MRLPFGPATAGWFEANFSAPTPVQSQGWPLIAQNHNVLLLAPTGSGKTLAAFLACIDRLVHRPSEPGVQVLYVSPLKALVYDIERNLRAPLAGIRAFAPELPQPRVAVRTGDTPADERRAQARKPAEILVTTPESLFLILGSQARDTLRSVKTVIIDEIHSLAPTKRGAHLALSLERLAELAEHDPQRIGLSATVRPVEEVAFYLGGQRPVTVVDTLEPPRLQLEIVVPVEDMENLPPPPAGDSILSQLAHETGSEGTTSLWPAIYPHLLEEIRAHRSTIVFVNSRGLCERLAMRLNELAGEELVKAHHGSVSHAERKVIEESLKAGALKGLVATSSLELGIDMGAVDLVLLVESPGSVARGLQRVGRAGHGVGQLSLGRIYPKFRGDLLECAVVAERMQAGAIEPLRMPRNALDVLAQQIVAMVAERDLSVDQIEATIRRAAGYRDLSREMLVEVLDMLSGRYPSTDFAELRPRLNWDRDKDVLSARPGARMLALVNAGTIPDRGLYGVFLVGEKSSRVGELDEEMVHEVRTGQTFLLGASTWRIEQITRDRVYVSPAPGLPGRMPFWKGDGPGRPIELGRALGAFLRQAQQENSVEWLRERFPLDALAAQNLSAYLREQIEATGSLPSDRTLVSERFRDELGDWRLCLLSPFGARVHAPWALALEARLGAETGFEIQSMWTDDGIVLRFADVDDLGQLPSLALDPEEVEDLLLNQLGNSALFAAQFRENAGRALLLPRRLPGQRTPLWQQRLRSQNLLAAAREHASFPIILETYRSCLQDVFDLPALKEVLQALARREVRLLEVETRTPSPFARSLVFDYVAAFLYQGDAPLAERRAQALTLDRNLLAELLGQEELRELLDPAVLEELEDELQHRAEERQARHADALHDMLRQLGDLSPAEIRERCQSDPAPWLEKLARQRRAALVRVSGEERWIAAEDAALYRDGLGAVPPSGLPMAFLELVAAPLENLLSRYARTRGPFVTEQAAGRFGLPSLRAEPVLKALVHRHQLLLGDFRPGGRQREWCDPEVLRRWRRRTLARLRGQVAPVESAVLGRFLALWHNLGTGGARLLDAIIQLEGLPLSFDELEKAVLPARLANFQPRLLDDLGQTGAIVWIGQGALGNRDGKVALYRRERVGLLARAPDGTQELEPIHQAILRFLEERGASFFMDLRGGLRDFLGHELEQAMEDLIWSGHVTNDLFAPLRSLGTRSRKTAPLAGRWTLVARLLESRQPTERTHAWVHTLLERYGVVSREAVAGEGLEGGFTPLYAVLKAMEEGGKVRRGFFVEGLSAAQFAMAGAVDRLRSARSSEEGPRALALAATDPANPYGLLLPWPDTPGRPRRAAGARVILVDGEPVLFMEKGQRKWLSFPAAAEKLELARPALLDLARRARGKMLRLQTLDGEPAARSPLAERLRALGFASDFTGLMLLG